MMTLPLKPPAGPHSLHALSLAVVCALGAWSAALPAAAQTPPDAGQLLREYQLRPALPALPSVPPLRVDEQAAKPASGGVRFAVSQVQVTGSTVFTAQQLAAEVGDLIGPHRGLDDLEAAAQRISGYYRDRGYTVARALVPAQDIRGGVVTISVIEGALGKAVLDNQSALPAAQVKGMVDALPIGQPVRTDATNRALLLLGELPGAGQVTGRLRPGDLAALA